MRRLLPSFAILALAACGTTPVPVAAPVAPPAPAAVERGSLIGLDATSLAARLGLPQLEVREGDGTKLQFARGGCILDAYLYPAPGGGGLARVSHVDTRNRDGRRLDQAACIALFGLR